MLPPSIFWCFKNVFMCFLIKMLPPRGLSSGKSSGKWRKQHRSLGNPEAPLTNELEKLQEMLQSAGLELLVPWQPWLGDDELGDRYLYLPASYICYPVVYVVSRVQHPFFLLRFIFIYICTYIYICVCRVVFS